MKFQFRKPLGQILKGKIEPYAFEVGILRDGPHKSAASKNKGLKSYAGGPARRTGNKVNGTLGDISKEVRSFLGVNYLKKPFQSKSDATTKLATNFLDFALNEGKSSKIKRLENLVQAVVRNPILRGAYGRNSKITADIKGFNRKLIDTAQFFKAIQARVVLTGKKGA